ncbi:hypothetical protein [Streptomyces nigra]|uniref:hypothetical protein n=1 Tax=Streptomyces nigra TaxID=1827580 RepID=UPI003824D617
MDTTSRDLGGFGSDLFNFDTSDNLRAPRFGRAFHYSHRSHSTLLHPFPTRNAVSMYGTTSHYAACAGIQQTKHS